MTSTSQMLELSRFTDEAVLEHLESCRVRSERFHDPTPLWLNEAFSTFAKKHTSEFDLEVAYELFSGSLKCASAHARDRSRDGQILRFKVTHEGEIEPTFLDREHPLDADTFASLLEAKVASSKDSCKKCPAILSSALRFCRMFDPQLHAITEHLTMTDELKLMEAAHSLHKAFEEFKSQINKLI